MHIFIQEVSWMGLVVMATWMTIKTRPIGTEQSGEDQVFSKRDCDLLFGLMKDTISLILIMTHG